MALGPTQPLTNEYQRHLLGAKGGRGEGLKTLQTLRVNCPETVGACPGP